MILDEIRLIPTIGSALVLSGDIGTPVPLGFDLVCLRVSRADVTCGDPARAARALGRLLCDATTVAAYEGRLSYLVESQADYAREIHAIPEVRAFFKSLDARFPYWLHFLPRKEPLADLWRCLAADSERDGRGVIDPLTFQRIADRHVDALANLYARFNLDRGRALALVDEVREYFLRQMVGTGPDARGLKPILA